MAQLDRETYSTAELGGSFRRFLRFSNKLCFVNRFVERCNVNLCDCTGIIEVSCFLVHIFATFCEVIERCCLFQASQMSYFENDFSHVFLPLSTLSFTLFDSLVNSLY